MVNLYRVNFLSVFAHLLLALIVKNVFYILLCAGIFFLGKRYMNRSITSKSSFK